MHVILADDAAQKEAQICTLGETSELGIVVDAVIRHFCSFHQKPDQDGRSQAQAISNPFLVTLMLGGFFFAST